MRFILSKYNIHVADIQPPLICKTTTFRGTFLCAFIVLHRMSNAYFTIKRHRCRPRRPGRKCSCGCSCSWYPCALLGTQLLTKTDSGSLTTDTDISAPCTAKCRVGVGGSGWRPSNEGPSDVFSLSVSTCKWRNLRNVEDLYPNKLTN